MLGRLIDSLDDPAVAQSVMSALEDSALGARMAAAADAAQRDAGELMGSLVRGFVETASDDDWVQLIGVMGRAGDPTLAAMRAILDKTLPR